MFKVTVFKKSFKRGVGQGFVFSGTSGEWPP